MIEPPARAAGLKASFAAYAAIPLTYKFAVAFAAGAVVGWLFGPSAAALQPLGDVFIRLLRWLVFPVVITTILTGMSSTDVRATGSLGLIVIVFYLSTTLAATATGTIVAALLHPGAGMVHADAPAAAHSAARIAPGVSGVRVLSGNLVAALTNGGLLPATVTTIAIALLVAKLRDTPRFDRLRPVTRSISLFDRLVRGAIDAVMLYAPIGTFALIAVTFSNANTAMANDLARVFASVYLGQLAVVAGWLVVVALVGVPVWAFVSQVHPPLLTAFATGSSAASLPVEIETARRSLGVAPGLFAFSLPLGVAIHKTGTAVHLAVTAAFASNIAGQPMSVEQGGAIAVAALIAAVVTPPVSGGSYVVMAGMLQALGLPLTVIAMVAGIPFIGKLNTPINALGRLASTVVVAQTARRHPVVSTGTGRNGLSVRKDSAEPAEHFVP